MTTFGQIISELREASQQKRQEVANALGISRASLEYYEKDKRKPDIEILKRIADYYHVSADYLLGRTNVESTDRDVQFVCEYTRLDENVINILHRSFIDNRRSYLESIDVAHAINLLVSYDSTVFTGFLNEFHDYENEILKKEIFQKNAKTFIPSIPLDEETENRIISYHLRNEENLRYIKFKIQELISPLLDTYTKKTADDEDYLALYQYLLDYNESERKKFGTNMTNGTKTAKELKADLIALRKAENRNQVPSSSSAEINDLIEEMDEEDYFKDNGMNADFDDENWSTEFEIKCYLGLIEPVAAPPNNKNEDTNEHTETQE